MHDFLRSVIRSFLDIIYVPECLCCSGDAKGGMHLCNGCLSDIHFLCTEVSAPVHNHYFRIFSIAAYEGPLVSIIHRFKYGRERSAYSVVRDLLENHTRCFDGIDCIVPVPQNYSRYLKRGYNQSVIIAQMVSKIYNRPVYHRVLRKIAGTPPQAGMSLKERMDNLKGVFGTSKYLRQSVKNKGVLLVDDVVTSGATVDECARVLKMSGAGKVDVLTLAKTL